MRRVRGTFSYANVISTLCLILLVGGGTAYAAAELGKESVGARQLKKGAVTPAKLAKASVAKLTGPQGAVGPAGAKGERGETGAKGERGEVGPAGPGAVFVEGHVGESSTAVATIDGITILGTCLPGSAPITLRAQSGSKLAYFGTRSVGGTLSAVQGENQASVSVGAGFSPNQLHFLARNEAVDLAWQRFDLQLDTTNCTVTGTVTPSG